MPIGGEWFRGAGYPADLQQRKLQRLPPCLRQSTGCLCAAGDVRSLAVCEGLRYCRDRCGLARRTTRAGQALLQCASIDAEKVLEERHHVLDVNQHVRGSDSGIWIWIWMKNKLRSHVWWNCFC